MSQRLKTMTTRTTKIHNPSFEDVMNDLHRTMYKNNHLSQASDAISKQIKDLSKRR